MSKIHRRVIETESSNTNVVVEADEGGLSITLEPMEYAVKKMDIYDEELDEFIDVVTELSDEVVFDDPRPIRKMKSRMTWWPEEAEGEEP